MFTIIFKDPTQPIHEDDPGDADEAPPEQKEKEKKKKPGAEGENGEQADNDPPKTITTGATSAAAGTIQNNLDIQTVTAGKPNKSKMKELYKICTFHQ